MLIPFTLVSFAYTALGQLPAAITGHPLIPWNWLYGLFILVLAAMTVSVVRNHLFEVQIVIRRWGLRIIAILAGLAGVLALWRLLIMPRTRPADWSTAAAAGVLTAALCITIVVAAVFWSGGCSVPVPTATSCWMLCRHRPRQ